MHSDLSDSIKYAQEDCSSLTTIVAEIDAIVCAPRKPLPPERQIAGINRALDRMMGITLVAMPPAPVNDDQPAEAEGPHPLARNPKKRVARPRKSQSRDQRILQRTPSFSCAMPSEIRRQDGAPLVHGPLPTSQAINHPLSDITNNTQRSTTKPTSKSTEKRRKADQNDSRSAPAWNRTTDIAKGACYLQSVSPIRDGLACSLNLGGKVLKAANDNPKAFKDWMHDRLVKGFKASPLGARDFVSVIELTRPAGRIHLHMALDATENEIPAVEAILAKAGGTWGASAHADRQAEARVMWGPAGWGRYMMKDHSHTKAVLGIKSVFSVTRGCRARAEDLWRIITAAA